MAPTADTEEVIRNFLETKLGYEDSKDDVHRLMIASIPSPLVLRAHPVSGASFKRYRVHNVPRFALWFSGKKKNR